MTEVQTRFCAEVLGRFGLTKSPIVKFKIMDDRDPNTLVVYGFNVSFSTLDGEFFGIISGRAHNLIYSFSLIDDNFVNELCLTNAAILRGLSDTESATNDADLRVWVAMREMVKEFEEST